MRRVLPWAWLFALLAPLAAGAGVEDQDLTSALRQLDTGDWSARMRTVHELEYLEADGIPALTVAAEDGDWQVRMAAVHALGPLGPKATPILKYILRNEPCPVVRLITLHNLGSRIPDGAEEAAMGWIFSASNSQVNDCRDQPQPGRASWAAGAGRSAPKAAASVRPVHRRAPTIAAADPQESHEAVVTPDVPEKKAAAAPPVSRPAHAAPTKNERYAELDALLAGPGGTPETLGDAPSFGRRRAAASAAAAAFAAPARAGASSGLSPRRTAAPESFPKAPAAGPPPDGPDGARIPFEAAGSKAPHDALPDLIRALKSGDAKTRSRAADELGYSGGAAAPAVPALIAALKDASPRVRASAGLALGNIGADDRGVVALLVKALKDKNLDVRYAATLALSRIRTPAAREAFRKGLGENARRAIEKRRP